MKEIIPTSGIPPFVASATMRMQAPSHRHGLRGHGLRNRISPLGSSMGTGQVYHMKFKHHVPTQVRFEKIVEVIVEMIEDGMRDQFVRDKAKSIIEARYVEGHDEIAEIQAIVDWVKNNLRYIKEPLGVEIFHTPKRLIKDIEAGKGSGDCDDFVILAGALLGSVGYPVGALIVDSSGDGTYNHVMLVTRTFSATRQFGNNWIPVELIYPDFKLGQSVPVSKVYPLMADARHIKAPISRHTISGLRGMTYGIRNGAKSNFVSTPSVSMSGFGSLNKSGSHIPRGDAAFKLLQNPKYSAMGDINWKTSETWGVLIAGALVGVTSVTLFNRFYK